MKRLAISNNWLEHLCVVYIIVWTISPPLQYGNSYRALAIIASFLWMIIIILRKRSIRKTLLAIAMYVLCIIIIGMLSGEELIDAITNRLQMIIFLLFICIFEEYIETDKVFLEKISIFTVLFIQIWVVRTLIQYQTTPGVSRLLTNSSNISVYYNNMGVGGYGLVYPIVFTSISLLNLALYSPFGVGRIAALAGCAVDASLVIESGYLIASIMLTCGVLISVITKATKHTGGKILKPILVLGIVSIVSIILLKHFQNEILDISEGTFYSHKLKEILAYFSEGEIGDKLSGRTSHYEMSWLALARYPLFGALIGGHASEIGGHSTIVDVFASYGLIIGSFYATILAKVLKNVNAISRSGMINIVIIVFIINGLFNTLVGSHGVAMFVIIPGVLLKLNQFDSQRQAKRYPIRTLDRHILI